MERSFQEPYALNGSQATDIPGAEYNGSDYDSDYTDSEVDLSGVVTAWKIIPPFLIVLGTLGNALIIAVLIRSAMQRHTTGMFLCALALSDLIGLYVGLFPEWISFLADENVHQKGNFLCKVLPWVTYSVLDYSAWILVAVTVERVIATCFPLVAKSIFTRRFAVGFLVSCGLILLCINAHMLFGFEYTEEEHPEFGLSYFCNETPEAYKHFFFKVWPWIDITIYCLVPFVVICVGNGVILLRVKSSYQKSVRSRNASVGSNNKSLSLSRKKGTKRISHLTATLLLINSGFFVSTFPISIFLIVEILSTDYFEDNQNEATIEMWWVFVYNFMFLNNTFNVVLYCLSGTKFRHGVLALFRKVRKFSLSTSKGSSFRSQQSGSYRSPGKDSKDTKTSVSVTTQNTVDELQVLTVEEHAL